MSNYLLPEDDGLPARESGEWVKEKFNIGSGDIDCMALHAEMILSDPAKHAAFKKNAAEQSRKFDLKVIMPQYEHFYNKVLEEFKSKSQTDTR